MIDQYGNHYEGEPREPLKGSFEIETDYITAAAERVGALDGLLNTFAGAIKHYREKAALREIDGRYGGGLGLKDLPMALVKTMEELIERNRIVERNADIHYTRVLALEQDLAERDRKIKELTTKNKIKKQTNKTNKKKETK